MNLLVPWLLFPAVLGLLSLGCGLLVEQVSGVNLPGALRLPAGLAALIVLGLFSTMGSTTASLTVPIAVGAAAAGFMLSLGRRRPRVNRSLIGLALGSFAVYAAPVVLSGQATFTGYIKLDDTGSFLAFTDQIMAHGRNLAGIAPSTYQRVLDLNIGEGYPIGTFLPLGIGSRLTGEDPAWTYQPCMAFYAAMAALALYALLDGVVGSPSLRAFSAFIAGQAALLYAYSLWGGSKELAAAALIGLTAALAPVRREELKSGRALIPFAVAGAATLGVLSVTGILWVGLLAVPALVILVSGWERLWRPALLCIAAAAALSIPSLVIARQFLHYATSNLLTQSERLGNLFRPLRFIQIFGIWTTGDFRSNPGDYTATKILIAVCACSALGAALYAFRRRAWRLVLVPAVCIVAALFLQTESSPWLAGKALATGAPFLVLLGLVGAAALVQSGRGVEGAVVAIAISGGVLWSNALAYRAVWLAPRAQLAELQQIGNRFSGDGPTLMTEYQIYGVRHFLRSMDAEAACGAARQVGATHRRVESRGEAPLPISTPSATPTSSSTGRTCCAALRSRAARPLPTGSSGGASTTTSGSARLRAGRRYSSTFRLAPTPPPRRFRRVPSSGKPRSMPCRTERGSPLPGRPIPSSSRSERGRTRPSG